MSDPFYIIGIDLGTTNSIVAYTKAEVEKGEKPEIHVFDVPQLTGPGVVERRKNLPSFLFLPPKHDVKSDTLCLPWNEEITYATGEFARERGAELPEYMIASAKSWLCHEMVDRNKPILPWGADIDHEKMSPVKASSVVIQHIRDAWNHTMAKDNQALVIEKQEIYLTVPASFNAVARELTVKASQMAGLSHVTLLEEPQAAFYAWIQGQGDSWRDVVHKGDLVLVCDIGGGTSDFSLIQVTEQNGELALERIAVGDHLLVGGDNMDLTLAYSVSKKMAEKGTKLDSWQMRGLSHSCRKAKEKLLSDHSMETCPVTILGRGSSLIGGTIKTDLLANEIESIILDGFFPKCDSTARPKVVQKMGLMEQGLSYEADPAVTSHLAKFLSQKGRDDKEANLPTAVLFNGGIMKASAIRERILDVLSSWGTTSDESENISTVREIATDDFDLSVARGAAYYGLARKGRGIRIRGGLGRSYYIGVAASMPAVPGMPAPIKALCVAPFGMEEGTESVLNTQEFVLVVGEPVKFDLLASSCRFEDSVGTVVEDWDDGEIEEITFVEAVLDGEHGTFIPVSIEIRITEVGTLEFWCVSKKDSRKWKLEFNVREKEHFGV